MQSIRVLEPRVDIKHDSEINHIVLQGALRVTEQVNVADSADINQALWTVYPPSPDTIVDRLFLVRMYLDVVSTGGDFQVGTNDAPRQFPLTASTDVLTVQINGESISDNVGDKIHAFLCYGNCAQDRNRTWSLTTSQPDQYQNYSDWTTYGSARNVLAEYGENSLETPRGGFSYEVIAPNHLRYTIVEPLMMSPFYNGLGHQEQGFVRVNQINIAYRWKQAFKTFWSHSSAGAPITDVTVSLSDGRRPELLVSYLSPDLTQPIPRLQTLPYHKSQDYIKAVPSLLAGESRKIYTDTIRLSQIPRQLYLFVRRSRATSNFETADSFCRIDGMSVQWNNESGLLNNSTTQQLYEMSRRNGCNLSWTQWNKHRGSVACIEMGKDIGLLDNESAGCRGQHVIQVTLDITNLSGNVFEGELYFCTIMQGTFQIAENVGRATLGGLTNEMVMESRQPSQPHMDYAHMKSLTGGGFFSSLKSFVNKLARGVQRGAQVAQKVAPAMTVAFPELAPFTSQLGNIEKVAGGVRGLSGGRLSGGRMRRR